MRLKGLVGTDFKTKIFIKFFILIVLVSVSFTALFISHQKQSLTTGMIEEGRSLVNLLAYNSRLGVFSENPVFLEDPFDGILQRDEVLSVSVFTTDGKLLRGRGRSGNIDDNLPSEIMESILTSVNPVYREQPGVFRFWAAILTRSGISEGTLFYGEEFASRKDTLIGFANINISTSVHNRELKSLLEKSMLVFAFFLFIGSTIAYFVSKSVARPLNRLTEGVRAIEKGDLSFHLHSETEDEIGRLSLAFNKMADALDRREEELRSMASQLSLLEERERRQIATDLHDNIGQTLALSKIRLGLLLHDISEPGLKEPLREIRELIEQTIQYTRSLTYELSPPILYEVGFEAAIEQLAEQLHSKNGLSVDFEDDERPKPLGDDVRVLLYKVVNELLMNVVKHSKADLVRISVRRVKDSIHITVEDDGVGFQVLDTRLSSDRVKGFGLFSIRERLRHFGGRLDLESPEGGGTRAAVSAPLQLS
jgi:signal transduction histidine kinase